MRHPIFSIETRHCTEKVRELIRTTMGLTRQYNTGFITPELVVYALCQQEEFKTYCSQHGVDLNGMQNDLDDLLKQMAMEVRPTATKKLENGMTLEGYAVMPSVQLTEMSRYANAFWDSLNEGNEKTNYTPITMDTIIEGICRLEDSFARFALEKYLGSKEKIISRMRECYFEDLLSYSYSDEEPKEEQLSAYVDGKKMDLGSLSEVDIFGKMMNSADRLMGALNLLGKHLGQEMGQKRQKEPWEELVTCLNDTYIDQNPLIGREKELERTIRILGRRDKNNPLFIGEPGVGKTALIYGLTRMIEEGRVPQWLSGYRIYAVDTANMLAGASMHGEFEKRLKDVLEGAQKMGDCILYIDEMHNLIEAGGGNQTMNAGEILKPYLEGGTVSFIGTTTYSEYNRVIAKKKSIARRFRQIDIKEPSIEETIGILHALKPDYEGFHGVKYTDEALEYIVKQTHNLIHDRFLPDKAIDIMDEAGSYRTQFPLLNKNNEPKAARYQKVDKDLIRQILTDVCRIDAKALASEDEEANANLRMLDKRISNEIYGQDEAISQVVKSVMMSKAGLMEPNKPMASLLFVGPTGVGKTEVCRVLAQELGVELVRFDMSEYTEKHSVAKLIGSPAGYVGYDEGGLLTDAIRKTPNCVLLLDEIEKAHEDIYNILLQVMDYASLTDNKGNKADFRNVILVMTSNAGAQFAGQAGIGFGGGLTKGQAMLQTVKKTFKPEFLNRLSGTVVFNEMDETMASLILDKKLRQLSQRLESKGVTVELNDEARQFLLRKGYDRQYGARQMDRVLNQYLTPLLMEEILFGKLQKGGQAQVGLDGEALTITAQKSVATKQKK